jgi:hypothetical protein
MAAPNASSHLLKYGDAISLLISRVRPNELGIFLRSQMGTAKAFSDSMWTGVTIANWRFL